MQKKINAKKISEGIIASLSPPNRNRSHNRQKKVRGEVEDWIVSPISSDFTHDEKKTVQEKTKIQSLESLSKLNETKEDTNYDSRYNNSLCDRKVPKTETKSKVKPTDSRGKKKLKKKIKKNEGEEESRKEILLESAVRRICYLEMENPSDFFLIGGDSGVGKMYWIDSQINRILLNMRQDIIDKDAEDSVELGNHNNRNCYPAVCVGKCEIPPRGHNENGDDIDTNISDSSSTLTSSMESFGSTCGVARPPMHAISEALNNLIRSLSVNDQSCKEREKSNLKNTGNIYGGKHVWKKRVEDALGTTEASYLASTGIVPELGFLLNLPGFGRTEDRKKRPQSWDWNSPFKFHRLCLAIRDLLRAVSECHHPVIMVLDNLHQADMDTYRILNFLLTSDPLLGSKNFDVDKNEGSRGADHFETRLKNFLLIGLHENHPKKLDSSLHRLELCFSRRKISLNENELELLPQNGRVEEAQQTEQPRRFSYTTKIHMEGLHREKVETFLRSHILNYKENMAEDEDAGFGFKENLEELAELIYEWTGGNIFYILQVCNYLKEIGAIDSSIPCKWNISKIYSESLRWNDDFIGLIAARIDRLPKTLRFVLVNLSAFRQTHIEFSVEELFHLLNAAYAERGKKKKRDFISPLECASELKAVLELACDYGFMKRVSCQRNNNDGNDRWGFAHTILRDGAYSLFSKKRKKFEIHFRLGSEASALASVPFTGEHEWSERSGDIYLSNMEHDVLKFLAADQLTVTENFLDKNRKSLALRFIETAEMCTSKSAFCAAIRYLVVGIDIMERNGDRFAADNHGVSLRMNLLLARLRSVCDPDMDEANKVFCEIFENCKNLKDQIMLNQAKIGAFMSRKNYQEALKTTLHTLEILGEKIPHKKESSKMLSRQIKDLIQQTRSKDNQSLLKPIRCIGVKTFDVIALLSNLIDISRLCNTDTYEEIAMIRMVNICLTSGYTPQYSVSFAHYGAILMERAFATNDFDTAKEGYRMGQICEKVASVRSFYGGHALAIFHSSISHWRRPYRRSLGHILSIYNAQLASGDYFHIQYTTFLIIQYHLTSGHNLIKLDDTLHLFDVVYKDYNMENHWKIKLPQRLVSNMLGETSDPFLFFGKSVEDHNLRIQEMKDAGHNDAIQLMYFLLLFASIFFHNHELSKSCLSNINKAKVLLIWKPWVLFFQCYLDIISLSTVETKAEKKKLREIIRKQRDRLMDWYNEGFVNFSFMLSLIDAEYAVTDTGDKKPLSTLRMKKFFDEAIAIAHEQGLKHIEAFCFERASIRFEAAGADGLCAEYIAKAHHCYTEWSAFAKVDDLQEKYASKLKLSKEEKIVGEGYVRRNSDMQYDPERKIGGGRKKIKAINMKGVAKTAGKVKKIALGRPSSKSPWTGAKGVLSSSRRPSLQHKFIRVSSQKPISKSVT